MDSSLSVGDVKAQPGETKTGKIAGNELSTGDRIDMPVIVKNGEKDGPVVLLFAVQHGKELQGATIVQHVMNEEISSEKISGGVIGIPVANPLGFMHQTYRSWVDNRDIGEVSVEDPNGNPTERLANRIWEEAWSKSDVVLNLHANDHRDSLFFQLIDPTSETEEDLARAARAFGITTIQQRNLEQYDMDDIGDSLTPTLSNKGAMNGIPEIMVEFTEGRYHDERNLNVGVTGITNVMKEFGLLSSPPEEGPQQGIDVVPCKYTGGSGTNEMIGILRADKGGILIPEKTPGEPIEKGGVVATVRDLYGDVVDSITMPEDGYMWAYAGSQQLATTGGLQSIETGGNVGFAFRHVEDE